MSNARKIYMLFSWLFVVVIMFLIFGLSAQDAEESKELSDSIVSKIIQWLEVYIDGELIRKFAHMLEFAALSFCLRNAIFTTWETKKASVISLSVTILCAITDEIHQIFVPGRAFQLSDLLIDSAGAVMGIAAYMIIYKIFMMIKERGNNNGSIKTI